MLALKPLTPSGTTISWAYWGDGSYLRALSEADLIVNCTPLGVGRIGDAPASRRCRAELIQHTATVFDLVYNPAETPLVAAARSSGAKAVSGLGMLVYQAAESFKLWTAKDADTAVMFDAARALSVRA